jgi:TonB family protein
MRSLRRVSAALAALCVCSSPGPAQVPEPIGKWVVDYATTQCTASRSFATSESTRELGIIPIPNEQGYEIIVLGTGRGPDTATEFRLLVGIGTNSEKRWVINYNVPPAKSAYRLHLSTQDMEQLRLTQYLWLRRLPDSPYIGDLKLGSIDGVLKALHACMLDLKRYWNVDGIPGGHVATVPGDLRNIFKGTDYPAEALDRNQEGRAQYLLLIDETGRVAGCHLLEASGIPVIDVMGCQVIQKRAKFKPALDANGKAARSAVTTPPIVWRTY